MRLAEIEIYPEYLEAYLVEAARVAEISMQNEAGVLLLFPMQMQETPTQFRIVEVYADEAAYQHHPTLNTTKKRH